MTSPRTVTEQLPRADEDARWFAFRTMFKREKVVQKRLQASGLETYVPLRTQVKHYRSKTVTAQVPLFSSYVFVRITAAEYGQVLRDSDVFEIVRFRGEVGRVTDDEIALLRQILRDPRDGFDPVTVRGLAAGTPVVLSGGTLAGTRGFVLAAQGKHNFVVELQTLGISLSLVVAAELLTVDTSQVVV